MAEQEIPYDAIIRTEIAIKILNQARAIVTARVFELEEQDPAAAERLRGRRRELLNLQERLGADAPDAVEDVIAVWGPRVSDEVRFWAEF
ncbi:MULTISPECIES: hypothetical protein [unclassified Ensifer]|uniref:hypothetical protein n=1 Tax=unclassified Ensifer TaxID=2633371 RepID=UPI0008133609|nr:MULTISPECIES: hypothetical protein [unclassified Ensifer]OCP22461.1 hypothetical protein BC361_24735 [Ensifer sp. LC54]OCP22671.1 hypothetical protein BC363_26870 [Ensifer sp. LC384]